MTGRHKVLECLIETQIYRFFETSDFFRSIVGGPHIIARNIAWWVWRLSEIYAKERETELVAQLLQETIVERQNVADVSDGSDITRCRYFTFVLSSHQPVPTLFCESAVLNHFAI